MEWESVPVGGARAAGAYASADLDEDDLKTELAELEREKEEESRASRSGSGSAAISFGVPASVSRSSAQPVFRDAPASAYGSASPSASLFGAAPAASSTTSLFGASPKSSAYTPTSPRTSLFSSAAPAAPPAPAPPPPPPSQPLSPAVLQASEDAVLQLVRLQSFDGSFSVSHALRSILGHTAIAQGASIGVDEVVWATVLAIAYLQKHLVGQPDLLEGLVEKAMEFVEQEYEGDVNALLERARAVVP